MTIDLIIPTYKPDEKLLRLLDRIAQQTRRPDHIILMNTEQRYLEACISQEALLAKYENLEIHHITKEQFDHGRTRNEGVSYSRADAFLLMTQDAVPASRHLVEELAHALEGDRVAVAYARQLPGKGCAPYERYARAFNYPSESRLKSQEDLGELGIKTYFCSNVCAMYNREIFDLLGGFHNHMLFNEDMVYAGTALQHGYVVQYMGNVGVIHSHNYTISQQFHRNFDIGVSQAQHPEIFGSVRSEEEGKKFVLATISYLRKQGKTILIPYYIILCGARFVGFRLGKQYSRLPKEMVKRFSMNPGFWT